MKVRAILYKCCGKALTSYPLDKVHFNNAQSFRLLCFDCRLEKNKYTIDDIENDSVDYSKCTCL